MKKVALLGDSMRLIGYGKRVAELLSGEYEVWQPADNCRYAKYTLWGLRDWKSAMEGADIVHWNNGLWDTCNVLGDGAFSTPTEYADALERVAKVLLSRHRRVIFATSTPVLESKTDNDNVTIVKYNGLAIERLSPMGVIINDLHNVVWPNLGEYISEDKIHLSAAGIEACAEAVAKAIRNADN